MSTKRLSRIALIVVLALALVLAITLAACDPNAESGGNTTTPEACAHEHLGALIEGKAATCIAKGTVAHYHCADCGKDLAADKTTVLETTEIAIDANAHDFDAPIAEVPATCVAAGTKAHKDCKLCKKHFDETGKEIPEAELALAKDDNAHKLGELIPAKAATCIAAGEKAHFHCELCSKDLAEDKTTVLESVETAIDANAHDFDAWVAEVPATCSATGTAGHKDCKLCKKHFDNDGKEIAADKYTLAIDSTAHKYGELKPQKDATCVAAGEKAHKDCTLCGKHFGVDNVEIPEAELAIAKDDTKHAYGELIPEVPATCGKDGVAAHFECSLCQKKFDDKKVEKDDEGLKLAATGAHTYDKYENLEAQGHKVQCSVCDQYKSDRPESHVYDGYVQDGVQGHHQECACGYHTEIEKHDNGKNPYTDYEGETHSYECEKCGRKVTDEHTMGAWQIDGEGKHYKACVCGKETEHGEHNYGDAPVYTDAKDGQHHTVVCTVCQVTVTQNHTPKLVSDDAAGHHTECEFCDYKTQTEEHKLGEYLNGVGVPGGGSGGVQNYHYKKCSECPYKTPQEGCKYEDSAWQMTDKECWKDCSICGQTCTQKPAYAKKDHNKVLKHTSQITEKQQHWEQCDRCGKIYGDKVDCVYEETYAPSKGNPSSYHEYYCTTGQHEVLRKNHEWDDAKTSHWVPKPDDEANKHVKGFTCTVCGYVLLDPKSSDEGDHKFGSVLTDDQGLTYQQCSDCKYETEHKKAHTHKWTVTEEGWYEGDGICEGGDGCTESVYKFDEKTGTISAYIGEAKKIKLPDSINGHQVVKLANQNSTSPYIAGFATVEYIQIPNTVTEIGAQTFLESGLIEVTIPNSVNTIGATLFKDSTKLQSVVMGSGISELKATFSGCTALKNILFLYEGIPSVNAASFKNCNALENVYIRANKEAFEAAKTATTFPAADKLSNSNLYSDGVIKLYYDTNPYEGGIDLSGYGAWHFDTSSKQELANILIWDKH